MRLFCDQAPLLRAVRQAGAAVPSRAIKPILQSLKMVANKDGITIAGTDLEFSVKVQLDAAVEESGETLVPAAKFSALLAAVTCETVKLACTDGKVVLTTDTGEYVMRTEPVEDFPAIGHEPPKDYAALPATQFGAMLRQTIFATGSDEARYILGGVRLEFGEPGQNNSLPLAVVGCDARVLAWWDTGVSLVGDRPPGDAMVPAPVCQKMIRMFDKAGDISIAANDNTFFAWTDRISCCARLLEGRYPVWRDIVKPHVQPAEVACAPLAAAFRRAAIVVEEVDGIHPSVTLSQTDGGLEIRERRGDVAERIPAACGPSLTAVVVQPTNALAFLSVIEPEALVTISLLDDRREGMEQSGSLRLSTEDGANCLIMGLGKPKKPKGPGL